ncbi:structural maintenance of chromosomes protein 1A-like [Venturia canescens]|uniref:structural maintenance of chromosomes protein 1A-like n=1 Tax=Venturia canescens TaxID=32260 RepID=UPI001C9CC288|nr:structural maintenance of chromosomes protein 1A-like [Venturia canescens]
MVILVQLELNYFKTYVRNHILKFNGKFIVVTGPNGCGKSNLQDAIAFVMGAKLSELRVSRLAELRHPSQPQSDKNPGNRTFVKIILQSNDGMELCFQRSVVDSQNKYSVNDNEVTYDDYEEALKKLNIHTRVKNFLILQDSIDSILMKNPIERTLMFEELSGSITDKPNYDRLKRTVTELTNEHQMLMNTKKSIAKKIKDLQLCRRETIKFQQLLEENRFSKLQLFLFNLHHTKRDLDSLHLEERNLKDTIKKCERKKDKVEHELAKLKEDFAELSEICEKKDEACKPKELELKKMTEALVEIRARKEYFQKQVDSSKKIYESAKKADEARKQNIQELETALKEVQRAKAEYIEQHVNVLGSNKQLSESEVREYERLKNAVSVACMTNNHGLSARERELKNLEDIYNYENTKLVETKDTIKRVKIRKENITERISKLQNFVAQAEADLDKKRAAYEQLTTKFTFSEGEVVRLREEIEKINEQIGDMKEDEFCSFRRTHEIVKELQKEFPGVYGSLGELCKPIHERYTVALTKVLGANVDAIIVNDAKTARQCIKYLRDNKIKVFTFLPLNQLRECNLLDHLRDINDPPNVKLLFDIIKLSPEISKAVFYATGNTLVCETQQDASKVAFEMARGHNCVSLDGCYYKKSGLISGGNHDLVRRAQRWSAQEKQDLKNKKENLAARLKEILKEAPKQFEISSAAATIEAIKKYSQFPRQDLSTAYRELSEVEGELKALEAERAVREEKVAGAKRNVDRTLETLTELRSDNEVKEQKIFAQFCIEMEIPNINVYENGKRLYDEKISEFDQQIDRIMNQLSYEEGQDTGRNIERWKRNFEQKQKELESVVESEIDSKSLVDKARTELERLKLEHQESMTESNMMKENISGVRNQLAKMSKELLALSKDLNKLQQIIGKKKAKIHTLLTEAKIDGFLVVENDQTENSSLSQLSGSNTTTSDTSRLEASMAVDYSKLPEDLQNLEGEEVEETLHKLKKKVNDQQKEIDCMSDMNMPQSQQLLLLQEKLSETNEKLIFNREALNKTNAEFDRIKINRLNKFNRFFDDASERIDAIYKQLMRNSAAQAFILSENPEEPYLAGIQYNCIVPGKSFQLNDNLSGGEKTMAALPLLFAIQSINNGEPPFEIFDEIDAALDHSNAMKVVNYMRNIKSNQTICISHKNEFTAQADTLIGITRWIIDAEMQSAIFGLSLSCYRGHIGKSKR